MRVAGFLALALLAGGCATMGRGTIEPVTFNSDPPGAAMRTSLGQSCTTPCIVPIARKDAFDAVFSKAGYVNTTVQVLVRQQGDGTGVLGGNISLTGIAVDLATGATLEHCPNPVVAKLERAGAVAPRRRSPPRTAPKADTSMQASYTIVPPDDCKPPLPPLEDTKHGTGRD